MKIDRLIGILSVLLQKEKVTAPYLAEKFEVSRRTINRDVEDLCKAGIPLMTVQGQNGGISIMEGYKMDKTLLTSSDMQAVLAGLRSLDSVSGTNRYQQLMEKFSAGNAQILKDNQHILIDLSSWYKSSLAPKIERIQAAIEKKELLTFAYFGPGGESKRVIEPYLLLFRWANWYVWGYCREKEDCRMFKLNRMEEVFGGNETFSDRDIPPFELKNEELYPGRYFATIVFDPSMQWRLIERYGKESFQKREDGMLVFSSDFTDKESLFLWLLGFGDKAELSEPEELRTEFEALLNKMTEKYKNSN